MLTAKQTERLKRVYAAENRKLSEPAVAREMALHPFHARIGEWITPEVGDRVLELGVGPGRYAALLQALGFYVVGVDPIRFDSWDEIVERGRCEMMSGVKAEALPFGDNEFDHVVCLGTLLYVDDPIQTIREIKRVLKPGGRLIIRTQNRHNLYSLWTGKPLDPAAHHLFSRRELAQLLTDHGFEVAETFSFGFYPPFAPIKWWYVMNVYLSVATLSALSAIMPAEYRHNITVFARQPDGASKA